MRRFACLIVLIASFTVSASGQQVYNLAGEDITAKLIAKEKAMRADLFKPFEHWMTELASPVKARRIRAAAVLQRAAGIVRQSDIEALELEDVMLSVGVTGDDVISEADEMKLADRFRREFRAALPRMIELLKTSVASGESLLYGGPADGLSHCIAASWPDGRGIVQARRQLQPSCSSDQLIHLLIQFTAFTMPDNKTLHPLVIHETRRLCPETRRQLATAWNAVESEKKDLPSLGLGFAPMVVLPGIIHRDATQKELPLFIELVKPRYPQAVRCLSLVCLDQLGAEAERVLPAIRELVTDESKVLREIAARVVLSIEADESKIEPLADQLRLEGKVRNQFIDDAREIIVQTRPRDDELEYAADTYRETLKGKHGGMKRDALRQIRFHGPRARHLRPAVEEASRDSDAETRRLAKLALQAIDSKTP